MKFRRLSMNEVAGSWMWVCVATIGCASEPSNPGLEEDAVTQGETSAVTHQNTSTEATQSGPLFGGPNSNAPPPPTTAPTTTATPNEPPVGACDKAVAQGAEPLIDDFEDGDQVTLKQDGRDGTWYFYDDGTSGSLEVNVGADGRSEREGLVLSVAGEGFSDWGSGFGVGLNWNDGACTYDASVYSGVQFWVRGTGETRITLQNLSVRPIALGGQCAADATCFDSHGVSFTIPEEWTLMRLPFSEFSQAGWGTPVGPLRTEAIYLLEFQFEALAPFTIALDDVSFIHAEPSDGGTSQGGSGASTGFDASTTDVVSASGDAGEVMDASVVAERDAM